MPRDPVTMGDRSTLPGLIVEQRCFIDLIVCLLGWQVKTVKTLHLLHAKKGSRHDHREPSAPHTT